MKHNAPDKVTETKQDTPAMSAKSYRHLVFFSVALFLFSCAIQNLATACPPPCLPCYSWSTLQEKCLWDCGDNQKCCTDSDDYCCNNGTECCKGHCCDPDDCKTCQDNVCVSTCSPDKQCCNGECVCTWEQYCCESDGCCDTECCGDKCCSDTQFCCQGTKGQDCCNNVNESCCDGKCFNFYTHMCCGGNICRQPCCDDWDCKYCDNGNCKTCLEKASDYEELTECSSVVDDPDSSPSANGCGPGGDDGVPDNPAWYACEGQSSSFLGPCNTHDIGYGTCGSSKPFVDMTFSQGMTSICNACSGDCKDVCEYYAALYATMVLIVGEPYWEAAQVEECACCNCG